MRRVRKDGLRRLSPRRAIETPGSLLRPGLTADAKGLDLNFKARVRGRDAARKGALWSRLDQVTAARALERIFRPEEEQRQDRGMIGIVCDAAPHSGLGAEPVRFSTLRAKGGVSRDTQNGGKRGQSDQ